MIDLAPLGYPGYSISQDGRVFSSKTQIWLRTYLVGRGYPATKMVHQEKGKTAEYLHRLVAWAYLPEPDVEATHVNHIDGDKENNRWTNLEWVSPAENNAHAISTGLSSHAGTKNSQSKLTDQDVWHIRELIAEGYNNTEIAREVGIERSTISRIRHGKRWAHVDARQ